MKCKPWRGDIDLDTMTPLKDGKPHMTGIRTCNKSDCVATDHVISAKELEAERHSLFYLTGISRTYSQLIEQLKVEA